MNDLSSFHVRSAAGVYGHVLCLPCHSLAISSGHQMASTGVEKSLMVANGSHMHLKQRFKMSSLGWVRHATNPAPPWQTRPVRTPVVGRK